MLRAETIGVGSRIPRPTFLVEARTDGAGQPGRMEALLPFLGYHDAQVVVDTGVASRYAVAVLKGK
jgi:hypothetical protein